MHRLTGAGSQQVSMGLGGICQLLPQDYWCGFESHTAELCAVKVLHQSTDVTTTHPHHLLQECRVKPVHLAPNLSSLQQPLEP